MQVIYNEDQIKIEEIKNEVNSLLYILYNIYKETIPFENNEDFEILEWWKKQQIKYPVLYIIARDVLTVTVSTVASEAAFSAGGRVVSKKRCNSSPEDRSNSIFKRLEFSGQEIARSCLRSCTSDDTENLNLSKHEWIYDNFSSP